MQSIIRDTTSVVKNQNAANPACNEKSKRLNGVMSAVNAFQVTSFENEVGKRIWRKILH